jgi:hypothetical protein
MGMWIYGRVMSSSTAGNSAAMSRIVEVFDNPVTAAMGYMGSATNSSIGYQDAGTWTSQTTGGIPSSVNINHIAPKVNLAPWFKVGMI